MTGGTEQAVQKFSLREGTEEDLRGIAALQTDMAEDLWMPPQKFADVLRWLDWENPPGVHKVLVGESPLSGIVAHIGLVPFSFKEGGRRLNGALPCQLVVGKEFRHSLLFIMLMRRLFREYAAAGVDFLYVPAITGSRILKAHLGLGFRALGELLIYARPLRVGKLADYYLKNRFLRLIAAPFLRLAEGALALNLRRDDNSLVVEEIERFTEESAAFLQVMNARFPKIAERTPEILNWRFVNFPWREYRLVVARRGREMQGYIALRKMPMQGFETLAIVDLLYPPENPGIGQALLDQAFTIALKEGVELISCLINPHSEMLPLLKRNLYLRTPQSFTLIVHEPGGKEQRLTGQTFVGWHLTWFDHDYV